MTMKPANIPALAGTFLCLWLLAVLAHALGSLGTTTPPATVLLTATGLAIAYTGLYRLVTRCNPVTVSLAFLGFPYLLFAFGWLKLPLALPFAALLLWALWRTRADTPRDGLAQGDSALLPAFLLVLAWVYLCGAGGYGLQVADYRIHNGRVQDLTDAAWPLRYEDGRYLVGYLAYYLPGALVGKFASPFLTQKFMHLWTLTGCWLVLRWLLALLRPRYPILLALVFILFGGWEIAGYSLVHHQWPWQADWDDILRNPDGFDYWTLRVPMGFFLGGFPSNTFSLFWSPHQVIAGWIVIAMMTHAFRHGHERGVLVPYTLLAFWSPMIMVALLPFMLLATLHRGLASLRAVLSWHGVLLALAVVGVCALFYLAGSTLHNPLFLVAARLKMPMLVVLPLMMLFAWGIYLLAIVGTRLAGNTALDRRWFAGLLFTLLVLPQTSYGSFNDLLCRGAAPLMLLLCVYYWRALVASPPFTRLLLVLVLLPGTLSAACQMTRSIDNYHVQRAPMHIPDYDWGWEFLGSGDAFFMQHLMKHGTRP